MLHEMGIETGIDLDALLERRARRPRRPRPPAGQPHAGGGRRGLARRPHEPRRRPARAGPERGSRGSTRPPRATAIDAGAVLVDIRAESQRERDGVVPGSVFIARNVLEWRCDPDGSHRDARVADPGRRADRHVRRGLSVEPRGGDAAGARARRCDRSRRRLSGLARSGAAGGAARSGRSYVRLNIEIGWRDGARARHLRRCCAWTCRRPRASARPCAPSRRSKPGRPRPRRSATPRGSPSQLALRDGERACVCDLAWIVGRDEKLVSHHARQLKAAGLARSERDGRMVMYELTDARPRTAGRGQRRARCAPDGRRGDHPRPLRDAGRARAAALLAVAGVDDDRGRGGDRAPASSRARSRSSASGWTRRSRASPA